MTGLQIWSITGYRNAAACASQRTWFLIACSKTRLYKVAEVAFFYEDVTILKSMLNQYIMCFSSRGSHHKSYFFIRNVVGYMKFIIENENEQPTY